MLERALEVLLGDERIDAVLVVVTDLAMLSIDDARNTIDRVATLSDKCVLACPLGGNSPSHLGGQRVSIPERFAKVATPERAAAALSCVCAYAEWCKRRPTSLRGAPGSVNGASNRAIIASKFTVEPSGGWLSVDQAAEFVKSCGIPTLRSIGANSAQETEAAASSIGFPVTLKVRSGGLVHKSDVGGVMLGVDDVFALREAYDRMSRRVGSQMDGAVVQQMAPDGVELIVGLVVDPVFGPVVMVGLGGVMTELLGDREFAVPPFDLDFADEMIGSLRGASLPAGYRGSLPVDRRALAGIIEKIANVADEIPEVVELDLNPVVVTDRGASAVDCKVRLAPRHLGPSPYFRAMRARRRVEGAAPESP